LTINILPVNANDPPPVATASSLSAAKELCWKIFFSCATKVVLMQVDAHLHDRLSSLASLLYGKSADWSNSSIVLIHKFKSKQQAIQFLISGPCG